MKVSEKGNNVVFTKKSDDIQVFADKIKEQLHTKEDKNIIIDLSSMDEVRPSHLIPFETMAQDTHNQKKSFVIVASIDFDEVRDEMIVVPTLQEAYDIIKMDEIERDLGF